MRLFSSAALRGACLAFPLALAAQAPVPPPVIPVRPGVPGAPGAAAKQTFKPSPMPNGAPPASAPVVASAAASVAARPANIGVPAGLNLTNASLTEVIDILARELKINYVLDPKVTGKVTINTYGELKAVDIRNLLETILRMNGYTMVQVGNLYRITAAADASRLPVSPEADQKDFGDNEAPVLDLIFLKYVSSSEMAKLLEPFMGEGYKMVSYDPANLLIIQDNSRNMKRTVDLINMFDAESMAGQRAKSFSITNARPSDMVKDLESIFKAYSLSDKGAPVKFIPIDRISIIIGVASNPQIFKDVSNWIDKLDVPAKLTAGATDNHVYKLKYGRAEVLGQVVAQLYGTSIPTGMMGYGLTGYGGYNRNGTLGGGGGGGMSGFGGGGGGYGGSGGSFGGSAYGNYGSGAGYGSGSYGSSGYGNTTNGVFGSSGFSAPTTGTNTTPPAGTQTAATTPFGSGASPSSDDQTGQYLNGRRNGPNAPRIIPNPFDNTLLVQSTPEQWESILHLLEQLDVPPRQVLIDAKIFEVSLTGALEYGVEALLQPKTTANKQLTGSSGSTSSSGSVGGLVLSAGTLVGRARELLATVNALETRSLAKSISAPQLIATDSIPASITVGDEIPTISGTSVATGLGGSVTSSIQTVGTGVNLNLIARVNSSGIVTLLVDQDISAPTATSYGSISSPTFSRRNVSTQVTVQDGDTIAIGGIVTENTTSGVSGIPFLDRLPYVGGVFGSKTYNKDRTELILFLTPHVIYDTNQITDATEEVKARMKTLKKEIRNE